ncbi:MAG: ubiquinol-cytochrome c reductase iron-sulfur subunit [Shimia sp.]
MAHTDDQDGQPHDHVDGDRRDFLYYATAGAGAVAVGAATWPLVNQMNPSADVLALATIRVDVGAIEPGGQITVLWQGKPVFIRRRTEEEVAEARAVPVADLPDPVARNENLDGPVDATDENRALAGPEGAFDGEWLVQMGVCTHLGCVPLGNAGDFDGWFCPCHGSHYDIAGRIRRGPAPQNLAVPPAAFVDETTIELG